MIFPEDQEVTLSKRKHGKDKIKKPKPQTLRDFLNG